MGIFGAVDGAVQLRYAVLELRDLLTPLVRVHHVVHDECAVPIGACRQLGTLEGELCRLAHAYP